MLSPTLNSKTFLISAAATTAQTLPENAAILNLALQASGTAGEYTKLTIVSAAPSSGDIEFTGTGTAPTDTVTLNAAPTATILLAGTYVPPTAFPRAA